MKYQTTTFGLLIAATLPTVAVAQKNAVNKTDTTVSRQIEIVKDYNPTIKEATKITTQPILKDDGTKKMTVNYSIWAPPFTPTNDSAPALDYALASQTTKEYKRTGYVKLGGGNYASFLGEAYLPLYQTKANLVELYGNHNSSFGKVRLTDKLYEDLDHSFRTKAKINDNFWKALYTHNFKAKELSAYGDFGYTGFNYYGYDGRNQLERESTPYNRKQAFTNFDAGVRFRTKKFIDKWRYDGQTNYQLFHTRNKLNEHNIYTNLNGSMLVDNGYIDLDFKMYNIFTSLPSDSSTFRYQDTENADNESVFIIRPAYVIKGKRSKINIGVKGAFTVGGVRPASIMPDIIGDIEIVPSYWFLYAGITGDYTVNNYRNMAKTNRYIALDNRAEDTYTPIDVYIGSKVNLFKYALLDLNIGYKVINNPYFFVADNNDTTSLAKNVKGSFYNLTYGEDEGLFTCGVGITTNWRDKATLTLKGKFNKWALSKDEVAWMMPKSEFNANLSVLPIEDLRVWLNYHFEGGRKALFNNETRNMKNVNDLSLGATYKALSWLNVFLNFNNILSSDYEQWYGYALQHFNLMGGVVVNF